MSKLQKRNKDFGKGNWKSYFRLIPFIHLPWFLIFIAFIVDLFHSEIMSYVPVSTSALFSGEFTGEALSSAVIYNVLNYGLLFGSMIVMGWVTEFSVQRSRKIMWGRMLEVKMEYYDTHNPSNLMSVLTNDTNLAVSALISQIVSTIPSLYYLYKVGVTLNSYDFRLLLSVLVIIPIEVIYTVIMGRWRYEVTAGINGSIGKLTAYLAERVSNISLIRAYTNEKQEEKKGLEATKGLYDAKIRSAKVTFVSDSANIVMELLQRGMPVIFGMILLQNKAINMQQWIAFFLFTSQINSKITSVLNLWTGFKSAQGSAARMVEIFDAEIENCEEGEKQNIQNGDIRFEDVCFAYGEKEVLHHVSCTIPQGKTTALVGRCGSGKTTLLSLVERLYTPKQGFIILGEKNVQEYDLFSYRNHLAYVQQDASIFGGTFYSAMTYGIKEKVTEEELQEAAQRTGLMTTILSLKDRFDAKIHINGGSISGGQRQRVVLSRELLKKRPVMLLDEPTSALDAMSALTIQQKLIDLFPGTTKLMITHDLRMLTQVDHVIFMEDGCVCDSGSHIELMGRCPSYRSLVLNDEEVPYEKATV